MNNNERFLLLLIAVMGFITTMIILPILQYVLLAIVLAYVLFPLHSRFREHVGERLSAISLISTALVVIVVPIVYILFVFTSDLRDLQQGETDLNVTLIEERVLELTGREIDLTALLTTASERLVDVFFGGITGVITTVLELSVGLALVLFLVFYMLREGEDFVAWIEELSPLPKTDTQHLFSKVNRTMWGSIIAHSCACLIQAVLAGTLMWLLGIPDVVFWTVVMAILSFLPLIGAFLVWAPASAYLVLVGQTTAGFVLFVYGLTVVNLVEHYVRPLLIDQSAHINPAVILIGVIGGIYTFGFVGLFIGPIVIGLLAATLETMNDKQAAKRAAAQRSVGRPPASPESAPDATQRADATAPPDAPSPGGSTPSSGTAGSADGPESPDGTDSTPQD